MQRLAVSTDVYVPPTEVYDFLVDFPGYARYSEYLKRVERRGDGGDGTVYDITVAWWRLSHTVRSQVTAVESPERIDWRVTGSIDARGAWVVEPIEVAGTETADAAPPGADGASRVTLEIRYDPRTIDAGRLDLPALFSLDGLVDRLVPVVEDEAEQTVERIVADLEGQPRPVELRVETGD